MSQYAYQSPQKQSISPQKQVQFQSSPERNVPTLKKPNMAQNSPQRILDGDLWKQRCNELEQSLCQANTELELSNFKAKKARELESRIDLILKQNAQLLGENDSLQKGYNQKKTESEIWKSKYENQMNTIIGMKANYELEIKKMATDLEKKKDMIEMLSEQKHNEVEDTKEKYFQDQQEKIETLKRNHVKNTQLYEEQVRKLQHTIEVRDHEIADLMDRLNHHKNDGEAEAIRLNDDREKLRARIQQNQIEFQKQLEIQRVKKDTQYNEQILALKKLHENEIDTYESELLKLKDLIQAKNDEINNLILQNKAQKENFDDHQQDLKHEIMMLKDKLGEHHDIKEDEINDLKEKLAHLHTVDINDLKEKHENYENELLNEIERLKTLLGQRGQELDQNVKEKAQLRESFGIENDRLKGELASQKHKYKVLEKEKEKLAHDTSAQLETAHQSHENFAEQMKNQIKFLEDQIDSLKKTIVKKNNEIDENIAKHKAIKAGLEDDIRMLRHDLSDTRKRLENCEYEKEKLSEEKEHKINMINVSSIDKQRKMDAHIDQLNGTIRQLKEQLIEKQEEIQNNIEHRNQAETDLRNAQDEVNRLELQLINMDKLKAKELEEQRKKLEVSNEFHISSLRQSTDNQIKMLQQNIDQHKSVIAHKESEIQQICEKHDQMQSMFKDLVESKDIHGPDYDQKLKKIGKDLVSSKNLYDVFVKSKNKNLRKSQMQ